MYSALFLFFKGFFYQPTFIGVHETCLFIMFLHFCPVSYLMGTFGILSIVKMKSELIYFKIRKASLDDENIKSLSLFFYLLNLFMVLCRTIAELLINLLIMFLERDKKLEHPERAYANTEKTSKRHRRLHCPGWDLNPEISE